jgi:hypothetical protein
MPDGRNCWTTAEEEALKRTWEKTRRSDGYANVDGKTLREMIQAAIPTRSATAAIQHMYQMRYRVENKKSRVVANQPLPKSEQDYAIIGHRIWRIVMVGKIALLESVSHPVFWPVGEPMTAHKLKSRQSDASSDPHTGIHAFDRQRTPEQYLKDYGVTDKTNLVRGTVLLWGRVIQHEHGYRAEFAYPDVLCVQEEAHAQALRRTYGCEAFVGPWKGLPR